MVRSSLPLVAWCVVACLVSSFSLSASGDCGIGGITLESLAAADLTAVDAEGNTWLVRPCGPTTNATCVKAGGPETSACEVNTGIAFGLWTNALWHKWTFVVRQHTTEETTRGREDDPCDMPVAHL